MPHRLPARSLVAAAALLAAACASEAPTAVADGGDPQLARGSSGSSSAIAVAGTWAGTTINTTSAGDSTRWSLTLRQNGDRLEGGLVRIVYVNGASFLGTSSIKRGSVSGQSISLEFDRGEGAEVAPTFFGTVESDGVTMTGFHSRYAETATLKR
jgi:hypothetical protein